MQKYFVKFLTTIQINYAFASNHNFFLLFDKGKKKKVWKFPIEIFWNIETRCRRFHQEHFICKSKSKLNTMARRHIVKFLILKWWWYSLSNFAYIIDVLGVLLVVGFKIFNLKLEDKYIYKERFNEKLQWLLYKWPVYSTFHLRGKTSFWSFKIFDL